MMRRLLPLLLFALAGFTPRLHAQAPFDYYLLSLSWAPGFCADPRGQKTDLECGRGRNVGFVVHGLWPSMNSGERLEECRPGRPVSRSIVSSMLPLMPSPGLIQHEWRTHGTCSGLPPREYFELVRRAAEAVHIPQQYQSPHRPLQLDPRQLEADFARANGGSTPDEFRVVCPNNEVMQVRACFSPDLRMIPCPPSVRDCNSSSLLMRPVQ